MSSVDSTSADEGSLSYLDGSTKPWASVISAICLALSCVCTPIIGVILWRRRKSFPINSTPIFLQIFTLLGASWYVISLLHSIVFPSAPCWLHVWLRYGEVFPFYCGTFLQLLRNACIHRIQSNISIGKKTWLTRNTYVISAAFLQRVMLCLFVCTVVLPVTQLSSRSSAVLSGGMLKDAECVKYASSFEVCRQDDIFCPLTMLYFHRRLLTTAAAPNNAATPPPRKQCPTCFRRF